MKKIFILFFALVLLACDNEKSYTLEFNLPEMADTKLVLMQRVPGEWISADSVVLDGSGFGEINGSIDAAQMVNIVVPGTRNGFQLFLDNQEYKISGSMKEPEIDVPSGPQVIFKEYQEGLKVLNEEKRVLTDKYWKAVQDSAEQVLIEAIMEDYDALSAKKAMMDSTFIVDNSASVVSAYLLRSMYYQFSATELEKWLSLLDESLNTSSYVVKMDEHLQNMKKVEIGQMYTDFTLPDPDGNDVSLSDLVGKGVLLIDFWASWCGPCRAANPGVVKLYNEFHEKGFDILGVSLDRGKKEWLQAIEDDGLVWTQISDIKYWQCEAAQLYAVSSIPSTVLLNKEGVIIAKNLSKEEMKAKLTELLGISETD